MDLRITTRTVDGVRVVELDGLADLSTVPILQSSLRREVAIGTTVIVDVDGLLALDDVALGVLLGAAATAREHGGDLEVLTASDRWRRRFRTTGFEHAVNVRGRMPAAHDTVDRYVAVIFSSAHTGDELDAYATTAARMEELAADQAGYLGIECARGDDGFGITVSYWRTEDDARAWKQQSEHLLAQATGRTTWYGRYHVRVATVTREYSYDASVDDELLHLALPDDWTAARDAGEYRISTRDRTLDDVGFVHCSYRSQLEGVANRFYADLTEVVILHIDPELLDAEVRVEPAAAGIDELFPHVYGPIPTSAVIATTWWDRGDDGIWRQPVQF